MDAPVVTDPGDRINSEEPFDIHWTKAEGALGYDTQIAIDPLFTRRLITSGTIGENSTMASFYKDVDEVTTYYFRVRAKNNLNVGPWSNIVDIIVIPPLEYVKITIAPIVTDPGNRINSEEPFDIHWTKVEGALGYDTQIAIDPSFTKRLIVSGTMGGNSTVVSFYKDVDEVTTYYFHVRAKNNSGPGPWSNVVDIIVLPEK